MESLEAIPNVSTYDTFSGRLFLSSTVIDDKDEDVKIALTEKIQRSFGTYSRNEQASFKTFFCHGQ